MRKVIFLLFSFFFLFSCGALIQYQYLKQGNEAFENSTWKDAIEFYSRYLESNPSDTNNIYIVFQMRGEAYQYIRRTSKAVKDFEEAIKIGENLLTNNNNEIFIKIAQIYIDQDKFKEAFKIAKLTLDSISNYYEPYKIIGDYYKENKELYLAISNYDKVIYNENTNMDSDILVSSHLSKIEIYEELDEYELAIESGKYFEDRFGPRPLIPNKIAGAYKKLGDMANYYYYITLRDMMMRNSFTKIEDNLNKAKENGLDELTHFITYAKLLIQFEKFDKAREIMMVLESAEPENADFYITYSYMIIMYKNWYYMKLAYRGESVGYATDESFTYYLYGVETEWETKYPGMFNKTGSYLNKAIEIEPDTINTAYAYFLLGYWRSNNREVSVEYYNKSIDLRPFSMYAKWAKESIERMESME